MNPLTSCKTCDSTHYHYWRCLLFCTVLPMFFAVSLARAGAKEYADRMLANNAILDYWPLNASYANIHPARPAWNADFRQARKYTERDRWGNLDGAALFGADAPTDRENRPWGLQIPAYSLPSEGTVELWFLPYRPRQDAQVLLAWNGDDADVAPLLQLHLVESRLQADYGNVVVPIQDLNPQHYGKWCYVALSYDAAAAQGHFVCPDISREISSGPVITLTEPEPFADAGIFTLGAGFDNQTSLFREQFYGAIDDVAVSNQQMDIATVTGRLPVFSVSVRNERLVSAPNKQGLQSGILLRNWSDTDIEGLLRVYLHRDLHSYLLLYEEKLSIVAGGVVERRAHVPDSPGGGAAVKAALLDADSGEVIAEGMDLLLFSDDLPRDAPTYGGVLALAQLRRNPSGVAWSRNGQPVDLSSDEEYLERLRNFGMPLNELYSWQPDFWSDWGLRRDTWAAGMIGLPHSREGIRELVALHRRQGLGIMSYAICLSVGSPGYTYALNNPAAILYDNPDAELYMTDSDRAGIALHRRLNGRADPPQFRSQPTSYPPFFPTGFAAPPNLWDREVRKLWIERMAEAMQYYEFDGIRWDGLPGVGYSLMQAWHSHGPPDVQFNAAGHLANRANYPDRAIAEMNQDIMAEMSMRVPGIQFAANWAFQIWERTPHTALTFVPGRMVWTENLRIMVRADGESKFYYMRQWDRMLAELISFRDASQRLCGYPAAGGAMDSRSTLPFNKHLFSLFYACGIKPAQATPARTWLMNFPAEYSRFALRHAELLMGPQRLPNRNRIWVSQRNVNGAPPLWYEGLSYVIPNGLKMRVIIHLLQHPNTYGVGLERDDGTREVTGCDVLPSDTSVPPALEGVSLMLLCPDNPWRIAGATVLSPEYPGWSEVVKAERLPLKEPRFRVRIADIPTFRYWAIAVIDLEQVPETVARAAAATAAPVDGHGHDPHSEGEDADTQIEEQRRTQDLLWPHQSR